MDTKIQKVHPERLGQNELAEAGAILRNGGLVAFPTETVYGLGGDALSPSAAEKIYAAKGRPSDNPLIVHIADWLEVGRLAAEIPESAAKIAAAFWPGPLTMIFRKREQVPASTTGGLDTVAVRMPNHPVALALIRQSGVCIAAPSANLSGRPSPTRAGHVIEDLMGKVDCIIDGGPVGIGLESTIVDLTGEIPVILRPGFITRQMLEGVVGEVFVDPAVSRRTDAGDIVARAPGMKYRHYAPHGSLTIVEGRQDRVIETINEMTAAKRKDGHVVAVIAAEETAPQYQADIVCCIGSTQRDGSIAAGLFAALRKVDDAQADYIYAENFEEDRLGDAIMNRLFKAAGYQIVQAV